MIIHLTEQRYRHFLPRILGIAALFSGAALVVHITVGISLLVVLALTGSLLLQLVSIIWRKTNPTERARLTNTAKVGIVAGILAVVVYDGSKLILSHLDKSPYNPFEAVHVFGVLLVGSNAPKLLINTAQSGFKGETPRLRHGFGFRVK